VRPTTRAATRRTWGRLAGREPAPMGAAPTRARAYRTPRSRRSSVASGARAARRVHPARNAIRPPESASAMRLRARPAAAARAGRACPSPPSRGQRAESAVPRAVLASRARHARAELARAPERRALGAAPRVTHASCPRVSPTRLAARKARPVPFAPRARSAAGADNAFAMRPRAPRAAVRRPGLASCTRRNPALRAGRAARRAGPVHRTKSATRPQDSASAMQPRARSVVVAAPRACWPPRSPPPFVELAAPLALPARTASATRPTASARATSIPARTAAATAAPPGRARSMPPSRRPRAAREVRHARGVRRARSAPRVESASATRPRAATAAAMATRACSTPRSRWASAAPAARRAIRARAATPARAERARAAGRHVRAVAAAGRASRSRASRTPRAVPEA
jgi:hypothetical protein